jgi:hypothetical protein
MLWAFPQASGRFRQIRKKKLRIGLHLAPSLVYPANVTDRRDHHRTIATTIAASGERVADVEKAAGLRQGELKLYLMGSDIRLDSLVAAGGLLGVSPDDLLSGASS